MVGRLKLRYFSHFSQLIHFVSKISFDEKTYNQVKESRSTSGPAAYIRHMLNSLTSVVVVILNSYFTNFQCALLNLKISNV